MRRAKASALLAVTAESVTRPTPTRNPERVPEGHENGLRETTSGGSQNVPTGPLAAKPHRFVGDAVAGAALKGARSVQVGGEIGRHHRRGRIEKFAFAIDADVNGDERHGGHPLQAFQALSQRRTLETETLQVSAIMGRDHPASSMSCAALPLSPGVNGG